MPYPSLERLPVTSLRPYDRNARTHSKKQIRQIADSIERFGFTNPVLISDDGQIIAGHGIRRPRRRGTMTAKKSGSYEVGYGRPPVKNRFQKAMTKSVTITENGKRKKISKLEAAITQLANDAARGD
jgi:hypothetical protein